MPTSSDLKSLWDTGDTQPLDVSSVHRSNTFLKYCVSMLSYGFYGDILKDSEKKRWMGPVRYDFSGNLMPIYATRFHVQNVKGLATLS